jgi:translocation and assembly module TamB
VRYPEGASTVADANIKLTGNSDNSTLAGTITIRRIAFNPHSDFGSMLSSAAAPVQTPAAPSPLLANMHLQIQVQTSPDISFQTSLAQNIQLVANLRVRGTAETPGVLGRVNITQGQLVFFGTKYNVNQGNISFYDPLRIAPVLDVNLETNVQGVDVILSVTGPIDNMQLTHRSDPPLPFNELVQLLATGKAPTSDPILAAHAPATPPQTMQQMGESALLGQVIANPVAGRLQRVFGVSQLKIAPAFVSGSELPQARMTLEQQVTHNVTFTYITDLTNTNEQVIRVEWAMNPTWSAVATRDENGIFSVDFFYKRRIK